MKDREKYFFDNITIKDEDITRAKQAIYSKGVEKHIIILEMLKAWINEEKVHYEHIASFYRYDKRLRKVLFVFISYLEELYRSAILDQFRFDWDGLRLNKQIKDKLNAYNDLDKALEKIDFSNLINLLYKNRSVLARNDVFPDSKHLRKNIRALIELRNCVMHNRFLLLYKGYRECYVGNNIELKSNTLKDNIINLIEFLPNNVKQSCRFDINNCVVDNNSADKTEWVVPSFAIINV